MSRANNIGFLEAGNDIHPLFVAQDANSDVQGDWLSMKNYESALLYFTKTGSEDVDDMAVQVLQATDASGTGSKALAVGRCWYKTGTLTGQGTWTPVNIGDGVPDDLLGFGASLPTGATRVVADVNTNPLLLAIEVKATDLDVANGFDYVSLAVEGDNADNTCLVSCHGILTQGSLSQAIPPNPLT